MWKLFYATLLAGVVASAQAKSVAEEHSVEKRQALYGGSNFGTSLGGNIGIVNTDLSPVKDTIVVSDVGKASITRSDGPNYTPSGPKNYNAKVWQLGNQEVTYVGNVVIIDWRLYGERKSTGASRAPVAPGPVYSSGPQYGDALGAAGPTLGGGIVSSGPGYSAGQTYGPAAGQVVGGGYGPAVQDPAYGPVVQDPSYGPVVQDPAYGTGAGAVVQDPAYGAGIPADQGIGAGLQGPGFGAGLQPSINDDPFSDPFFADVPGFNTGGQGGAQAGYQDPFPSGGYQDQNLYQGAPAQGGVYQGAPAQGGVYQGVPAQGGVLQNVPAQGGVYQGAPAQGGVLQGVPAQGGVYQGAPAAGGVYQSPNQNAVYQGPANNLPTYQGVQNQGGAYLPQTSTYSGPSTGNQYVNAYNQYGKRRKRSLRKKRQTAGLPIYGQGPTYGGAASGLPLYGGSAYGPAYGSYNVPSGPAFPNICVKRGTYLVFNWPVPGSHNVNKFISYRAYKYCSRDEMTGDVFPSQTQEIIDTSNLAPGYYYFACGVGDHCSSGGQKIAVRVATDYGDDCKYPSYGQYGLAGGSPGK